MSIFGTGYSKFKGSDAVVISLNHNNIVPSWGEAKLIKNESVFTRKSAFTKLSEDFGSFEVDVNIKEQASPAAYMIILIGYNHDTVNFMPHQTSGVYVQAAAGGDAEFYIESMTPYYLSDDPPILHDYVKIRFVALEALDISASYI